MLTFRELTKQIRRGQLHESKLTRAQEQILVDLADDAAGDESLYGPDEGGHPNGKKFEQFVLKKAKSNPAFNGVADKDILEYLNAEL